MLWVKPNLPIEFDHAEFDRLLGLVNSRNPKNKSNIIIVNTSGTNLGVGVSHRDVFTQEELNSPLINKALELLNYAYIKFLLVFLVKPNTPVLHHVHEYPDEMEAHFQTVVGLSPNNDINGLWIEGQRFDLTGHNHILLNVKLDHWVDAQESPNMWLTAFCSRMK